MNPQTETLLTELGLGLEDVDIKESAAVPFTPTAAPIDHLPGCNARIEIKTLQPRHLLVAYGFAAGKTRTQIAQETGYTPEHVTNIKQMPEVQRVITQLIHQQGGDYVSQLFQNELARSVETLISIRDNDKASASVRANCANTIIEHGRGKAVTYVKTERVDNVDDEKAEYARLLKQVKDQEALLANNVKTADSSPARSVHAGS